MERIERKFNIGDAVIYQKGKAIGVSIVREFIYAILDGYKGFFYRLDYSPDILFGEDKLQKVQL
jgi:hypothetical protein